MENFLVFADSRFRRNKGQYKKGFLEKAKFIAYGDVRMNDFGLYADVLLPCKTPYESWDLRTNPGYHRYANIAYPPPGLKAVGESKSEWEIATLVVEKLEALAKARHKATGDEKQIKIVDKTRTQEGVRRLDRAGQGVHQGRHAAHRQARGGVRARARRPVQAEQHEDHGTSAAASWQLNEKAARQRLLYKDRPYNTFENQLYLHQRFETLTGRLTFYVVSPAADCHGGERAHGRRGRFGPAGTRSS